MHLSLIIFWIFTGRWYFCTTEVREVRERRGTQRERERGGFAQGKREGGVKVLREKVFTQNFIFFGVPKTDWYEPVQPVFWALWYVRVYCTVLYAEMVNTSHIGQYNTVLKTLILPTNLDISKSSLKKLEKHFVLYLSLFLWALTILYWVQGSPFVCTKKKINEKLRYYILGVDYQKA